MMDVLIKILGASVLAAGGIGAVGLFAIQAFKHFGSKWLETKFQERLEALKHEQGKEIEQLRFRIAAMLDRATKLHLREFEVLPEAWSRMNDAFWTAMSFVSPVQTYPDINRMSKPHQDEFISSCRLANWQKEELRNASDKTKLYQEQIFFHDLHEANTKASDLFRYLLRNGIFIEASLRAEFSAVHEMIWNALNEHEINEVHKVRPRTREKIDRLRSEGEPALRALELMVHQQLWPSESAAPRRA